MKEDYILMICAFLLIAGSIVIGYNIRDFNLFNKVTEKSYTDSNCSNLSLFETKDCLENKLSEFYNYNLSNTGKQLTLEQLKEVGGVCEHYSNWYYDNIDSNFYKQKVTFTTRQTNLVTTLHQVTIISNKEGYCVLDMLNNDCWRFRHEN